MNAYLLTACGLILATAPTSEVLCERMTFVQRSPGREWATFRLLERTGSVCGKWTGRLPSAEQKAIFGRNLCGKREIEIDGQREKIKAKKRL